jgi:hypothetical protein
MVGDAPAQIHTLMDRIPGRSGHLRFRRWRGGGRILAGCGARHQTWNEDGCSDALNGSGRGLLIEQPVKAF